MDSGVRGDEFEFGAVKRGEGILKNRRNFWQISSILTLITKSGLDQGELNVTGNSTDLFACSVVM